jgi:hypothetical protein
MKRLTVLFIITALIAGNAFAQGIVDQPQGSDSQSDQQLIPDRPQRDDRRQGPDRLQRDDRRQWPEQRQRPDQLQRFDPRQRPDHPQRFDQRQKPDMPQRLDRQQRPAQPELKSVNVTGTLQLKNGFIALVSGDDVYYVPAISRLVGFIDGLKEGKQVTVEGLENRRFIHLVKLTVDGKDYDFPAFAGGQQGSFGPGRQGGQGIGPGQQRLERFDRGRDNRDRDRKHYAPSPNKGKGQKRGSSCCGGWA